MDEGATGIAQDPPRQHQPVSRLNTHRRPRHHTRQMPPTTHQRQKQHKDSAGGDDRATMPPHASRHTTDPRQSTLSDHRLHSHLCIDWGPTCASRRRASLSPSRRPSPLRQKRFRPVVNNIGGPAAAMSCHDYGANRAAVRKREAYHAKGGQRARPHFFTRLPPGKAPRVP